MRLYGMMLACLVAAGSTIGMAQNSTAPRPLHVAVAEIPQPLDPLQNEISTNKISKQIFQGLTTYDEIGNPRPGLAKQWTIDRAGKQVTFTIDTGRKFSDGSAVTPQDVTRSLVESIAKGTYLSSLVAHPDECAPARCAAITRGEGKVVVELQDHTYDLLLRTLAGAVGSVFKRAKDKSLLGTGPFKIDEYNEQKVVLKRWQDPPTPQHVREIHLHKMANDEAKKALLAGKIHGLWSVELTPDEVKQANVAPVVYSSFATYQLVLDHRDGVFSSPDMRRAFAMAVDRPTLLKAHGISAVLAGGYIPPGLPGHQKSFVASNWDEAAEIAKAAKPKSKVIRFAFREGFGGAKEFLGSLAKTAKHLGLTLKTDMMSFRETLTAIRKGTHDMVFKGDGIQYYDSTTIYVTLITGNFSNVTRFSDARIDQAIAAAQSAVALPEKAKHLEAAEKVVAEQVPTVPLYYPEMRSYYSRDLKTGLAAQGELRFWEFPYWNFQWKK